MTVAIKRGDLLRQEVDAIVNTVNTVDIMGKGIALQFKQKWPENFRAYERACREDKVRIGEMFIFDAGGLVKPHYIINFPTKEHWRKRSKIEYIERGLKDLIFQVQRLGIKSIALPPLGCGNGGLPWPEVRERIVRAFEAVPEVEVLLFEPAGAPRPQEQVTRTKRPKMTPGRAAIVEILSIYRQMEYSLTRLEVQTLAYLLAGRPATRSAVHQALLWSILGQSKARSSSYRGALHLGAWRRFNRSRNQTCPERIGCLKSVS